MMYSLSMTGRQQVALFAHLFPGDGLEAVCILLCGRAAGSERHQLLVHKIVSIPHALCQREADRLTWPTEGLVPHLEEAARKGLAIVKVHSHPGGYERFSELDDAADAELFPSLYGWMDDDQPHASAIMLPDGKVFGRIVGPDGRPAAPLEMVKVVGDDLRFYFHQGGSAVLNEADLKNAQAFGPGTVELLKRLTIGIVGTSGTGSPVIEQLMRLGVGVLVLVDADRVKVKNLNRIINATAKHAAAEALKVDVLADAIEATGLGTRVVRVPKYLSDPESVRALAQCDVVFGCVDSVDGRDMLNRLAAFYNLAYFDVGVALEADGNGGIDQICGTVHYLQPDGSSLLSRSAYTLGQLEAANLLKYAPAEYERRLAEKYIKGVRVERPAVISVNMFYAALAINEFLARLHGFKDDPNGEFAVYRMSLTQAQVYQESESESCPRLAKHAGRGDMVPLLNMPQLSG